MFHKETCFPDPGLCFIKMDVIYLPVGFKVLFKDAIVFYTSILIILQPVDKEIANDPVPFVLCKILSCHNEVDMIGTLSQIGAWGIRYPEVETNIQTSVDITAENSMKENFLFCQILRQIFSRLGRNL